MVGNFYSRDAMLARYVQWLCERPSVCHTPVLYRNGETIEQYLAQLLP